MEPYIWKRRQDGMFIINLAKTWEKLMLAARVIVAIENPADVCVISARPWGQRAVLKYAKYTGAQAIAGRFTPGTFTNQIQKKFLEPRLLIVTDPRLDQQSVREASYVNIPCIGFCHTDSPMRYIDIAIPCNNKGKHAIGLMYWLLCREVLRLRAVISRTQPWDVMVDMFFYRDPDEAEKAEEAALAAAEEPYQRNMFEGAGALEEAGAVGAEWGNAPESSWDTAAPTTDWGSAAAASAPTTEWGDAAEPAVAPVAASGNWDSGILQAAGGWDTAQPQQ